MEFERGMHRIYDRIVAGVAHHNPNTRCNCATKCRALEGLCLVVLAICCVLFAASHVTYVGKPGETRQRLGVPVLFHWALGLVKH